MRTCSVFVLPVPVAPATSPWRLSVASGTLIAASRSSAPSCTARPRSIAAPLGGVGGGEGGGGVGHSYSVKTARITYVAISAAPSKYVASPSAVICQIEMMVSASAAM